MRKILNLVKCEFMKNYSIKKWIFILLFSTFCVVSFSKIMTFNDGYQYDYYDLPYLDSSKITLYEQKVKENPTLENKFYVSYYKKQLALHKQVEELNVVSRYSWKYRVMEGILDLEQDIFIIDALIEDPNISYKDTEHEFKTCIYRVFEEYENDRKNLKELKEFKQNLINDLKELLSENKYYRYLEYGIEFRKKIGEEVFENNYFYRELFADITLGGDKNLYQDLIDEKVEDENNSLSLNIHQLSFIGAPMLMTEDEYREYRKGYLGREPLPSYSEYVRYEKERNKRKVEQTAILKYSIKHNQKQDIMYNNDEMNSHLYTTSKHIVNFSLHFSIIVLLLVSITSSGIISREHSKKTDKLLLTSPISRKKVLFSKFLYLILHAYIIWFVIFVIFFIYAGSHYGFTDLFTPKLVYYGGQVYEVNYILWTLKDMFVYGVPLIACLSILLMLSTVTLKTTITTGITTIMAVASAVLWHFIFNYKLFFLAYTPIPYLDFLTVKNHSENYLKTLEVMDVSPKVGMFVCILFIVICYTISHILYTKRDVKN